jgi:hypothetical protein
LLGNFNAKACREDISKLKFGNKSLHESSNVTGVRTVNFVISKNLTFKSTMFKHCNIHKWTWTYPEGKPHDHIDHAVDKQQHSGVFDIHSFRAAYCDTDHYVVLAKVRERGSISRS